MIRIRSGTFLVALASAIAFVGCAKSVPRYPVEGTVKFRGKLIPGAVVMFHPGSDTALRPHYAVTDDSGRYEVIDSASEDGLPAGSYLVTVIWQELKKDGDEQLRTGRNLLPARYSNPATSELQFTVKPEPSNTFPIELTDK
jgi:hypothetical protein